MWLLPPAGTTCRARHYLIRWSHLRYLKLIFLCGVAAVAATAQTSVQIKVDASQSEGPFRPIYRYFGYDEPNYTYAENGKKLVGELAALADPPVYIRAHHLLTSGDGVPSFKFGSTNAYTEDASGKPVYDWKIVDQILDTYVNAGARPFVELGFMPKALSTHPDPYKSEWAPGAVNDKYFVGWSYPPNDYAKWGELIHQLVLHAVARYGRAAVDQWYWEVWNEPDIGYWHGTPEEYDKLYDAAAAGVKKALPTALVGGPAITGPGSQRSTGFLKQFLQHCLDNNVPLDFITFHAKGQARFVDGHVKMGIANNLQNAHNGFQVVASFPKYKDLPIILSESDPEGCAACSARFSPQNAYRNGTLYASYTATAMKALTDIAKRDGVNLEGQLTWAFEFEGQPYFEGFRDLATNGVDKPILNFFRMAGQLVGNRVKAESSGAVNLDGALRGGVPQPDVDAIAVRSEHSLNVLVWNYQDNDVDSPAAHVALQAAGLPRDVTRVSLRHYRIDQTHSNAFTAWKQAGSPQNPSPEQKAALEAAGQLQMLGSPQWVTLQKGAMDLNFDLPIQGLSLIEISW
jgi:xylan 1,4-beta-xylosidase